MGIKGEPATPDDPARGLVGSSILAQVDRLGSESEFVSVAEASEIREMMTRLSQFLSELKATAEQWTDGQRWCRILSKVFERLLKGKTLTLPGLATASG